MTPFGEAPPSPLGCSGDCEEFRGAVWQHIKLTNVHVAVSAADGPRLKKLGDWFWFDSVILSLCSACNSSTDNKHSTGRKEDILQTYNQFVMWQLLFPQIPISDCLGRKKKKRKKESAHPFPLPGYCKLWRAGEKINRFFIPYRNVQERATAEHACDGCENVEGICILSGILLWHSVFEDLFLMLCTHSTPLTYA